jgi:tetratricopeptide (TPR) repeat protein
LSASVLLASAVLAEAPAPDLLQRSAAAYREGRLMDALKDAVDALEADPKSIAAKNYVLTIGEAVRKEDKSLTLRPGEKERSARAARAYLELQRRRTEDVVRELREASSKSRDLRSPSGFFSALQGLDRSLGGEMKADAYGGQAQQYFSNILENLQSALGKSSFVEAKDRFRAEGYLAYYKDDLPGAAAQWEKALREDPSDAQVKSDLESVRGVIRRRKQEKDIQEYRARAQASFEAGLFSDAVEAWREVYRRDPRSPGAVEGMSLSRAALEKSLSRKKIDDLMLRASSLYKGGDYTGAAALWLDVLQLDPTYQSARTWLRLVGAKLKEEPREVPEPPPSAPVSAGKPAAPPPEAGGDAEELYRKGLIAYSQGDVDGAMAWLRKSLAADPTLRRAQQALEQCQTETSLTRK